MIRCMGIDLALETVIELNGSLAHATGRPEAEIDGHQRGILAKKIAHLANVRCESPSNVLILS